MSTGAAIALFYGVLFVVLWCMAVAQGVTVWSLLAKSLDDIFEGFVTACAAVGLAPRPEPKRRVSPARIRQLERELGIDQDTGEPHPARRVG